MTLQNGIVDEAPNLIMTQYGILTRGNYGVSFVLIITIFPLILTEVMTLSSGNSMAKWKTCLMRYLKRSTNLYTVMIMVLAGKNAGTMPLLHQAVQDLDVSKTTLDGMISIM